jgi:hypothetical protein
MRWAETVSWTTSGTEDLVASMPVAYSEARRSLGVGGGRLAGSVHDGRQVGGAIHLVLPDHKFGLLD